MHEREASPPSRLRLLTLNAHKGFTFLSRRYMLRELREAVRAVGADLVFLQEVHGSHPHRGSDLDAPQYEFLADQIWPAYAYGRNAVYTDGHHGNAVLSKHPIVHSENIDVSIPPHEQRGLLYCVLGLQPPSPPVHAICVHLGLRQSHRRRQLERLCDLVATAVPPDEPLLVAGDFNDWRLRLDDLLSRRCGLTEVFAAAHGRVARTFPARWPLLRLDRIYVRNMRAHRTVVLPSQPWAGLSDHAPLAAEVEL